MAFLALLSDRSPAVALPALGDLLPDLKLEPLSLASLDHVVGFDPTAVLVDAVENPAQAWSVLQELRARDDRVPAMLIVERDQLERYPWHEVADEFVYPGAPEGELRVRLAMLRRRSGAGDGSVIRLGALALDTETYRVTANGRVPGPHVQGVRAAAVPGIEPWASVHAPDAACARSGATTSMAARAPWTCTCGGCEPSSDPSTST